MCRALFTLAYSFSCVSALIPISRCALHMQVAAGLCELNQLRRSLAVTLLTWAANLQDPDCFAKLCTQAQSVQQQQQQQLEGPELRSSSPSPHPHLSGVHQGSGGGVGGGQGGGEHGRHAGPHAAAGSGISQCRCVGVNQGFLNC